MAKQPMGRGSCWGRNQGEERMAMILRGAGCQPGTALCADRGAHSDSQVGSVLRVKEGWMMGFHRGDGDVFAMTFLVERSTTYTCASHHLPLARASAWGWMDGWMGGWRPQTASKTSRRGLEECWFPWAS